MLTRSRSLYLDGGFHNFLLVWRPPTTFVECACPQWHNRHNGARPVSGASTSIQILQKYAKEVKFDSLG